MKVSTCKPAQSKSAGDEFEIAVVAELRQLRATERILVRMYPRLKSMPQLRTRFLQTLEEMELRAQRLDAVLDPLRVLRSPLSSPVAHTPAA